MPSKKEEEEEERRAKHPKKIQTPIWGDQRVIDLSKTLTQNSISIT